MPHLRPRSCCCALQKNYPLRKDQAMRQVTPTLRLQQACCEQDEKGGSMDHLPPSGTLSIGQSVVTLSAVTQYGLGRSLLVIRQTAHEKHFPFGGVEFVARQHVLQGVPCDDDRLILLDQGPPPRFLIQL